MRIIGNELDLSDDDHEFLFGYRPITELLPLSPEPLAAAGVGAMGSATAEPPLSSAAGWALDESEEEVEGRTQPQQACASFVCRCFLSFSNMASSNDRIGKSVIIVSTFVRIRVAVAVYERCTSYIHKHKTSHAYSPKNGFWIACILGKGIEFRD